MSKSKDIAISISDIAGFDYTWPVGISILAFGFLIINILRLFIHFDDGTKAILSTVIPSPDFVPLLFLVYMQHYYWKFGEIVSNMENAPPDKIFLHTLYYMMYDIMGVVSGLAFGLASIWSEPSILLTISAFVFPMACLTISRIYIRQGIVGRKIYDLIDKSYTSIRKTYFRS
jgi:hypothetical protein